MVEEGDNVGWTAPTSAREPEDARGGAATWAARAAMAVAGPGWRLGMTGGVHGSHLSEGEREGKTREGGKADFAGKWGNGPTAQEEREETRGPREGKEGLGRKWPKGDGGRFYLFSFYFN